MDRCIITHFNLCLKRQQAAIDSLDPDHLHPPFGCHLPRPYQEDPAILGGL